MHPGVASVLSLWLLSLIQGRIYYCRFKFTWPQKLTDAWTYQLMPWIDFSDPGLTSQVSGALILCLVRLPTNIWIGVDLELSLENLDFFGDFFASRNTPMKLQQIELELCVGVAIGVKVGVTIGHIFQCRHWTQWANSSPWWTNSIVGCPWQTLLLADIST